MTVTDWAAVLATTEDPQEIRDCLLMLADDLPDEQGDWLRSRANTANGLDPRRVRPGRFDGWVRWWPRNVPQYPPECDDLPEEMRQFLDPPEKDADGNEVNDILYGRYYPTRAEAWLALLEALPAYVHGEVAT